MPSNELIPVNWRSKAQETAQAVAGLDLIVVAAHLNPDGDAWGSMLATGWILQSLQKKFILYAPSGIPNNLNFLPLPGAVCNNLTDVPFAPSASILLDCGEAHRLGEEGAEILTHLACVNIDHHIGQGMGSVATWVEQQAAATAQLVAYVACALNLPLTRGLAQAVALGVLTDTGGFSHGNTSADVLALCAELARKGCSIPALREQLEKSWTLPRMHLWGRLLQRVKLLNNERVAYCAVLQQDLRECGATKEDTEGLVEHLRLISSVRIAVLLREEEPEVCKFSLRSSGDVDVRKLAAEFGGGGHRNAAGGTIHLPFEKAKVVLLSKLHVFQFEQ